MNDVVSLPGDHDEISSPLRQELSCLPVFLALAGKRLVLAGGSPAILWKAKLCLAAGAEIEIFTADPCSALASLARQSPSIALVRRRIAPKDFHGAALAITEAESEAEISQFLRAAHAAGVLVNVIDKPACSDFQFGAIVNRSPLVVGISTSGGAPILAQALRGRLEARLPQEVKLWAQKAKAWRETLNTLARLPKTRRRFWELFSSEALAGRRAPQEGDLAALLASAENAAPLTGSVTIVGAGPGDPELLTLKALRALQSADVILYDDLVSPAIVEMARREAEKIPVGKRGYKPSCRQEHILSLMVSQALQGKHVVRLKGGDPMIFGRAAEEIAALRAASIPVEIIPGVTAALGAAATLQLSLTERKKARRLQFITAHSHDGKLPDDIDWRSLCDPGASTVVYMGVKTLAALAARLLEYGIDPSTPALLVELATSPGERHIFGTIETLPAKAAAAEPAGPCVILIGKVFESALSLPRTQATVDAAPHALAL
jgi:uroporphyrin-III C-methyltransferase/precorrin-2 dehydrogenase/sirohydrochlorin ferrochelatase